MGTWIFVPGPELRVETSVAPRSTAELLKQIQILDFVCQLLGKYYT